MQQQKYKFYIKIDVKNKYLNTLINHKLSWL